MNGTPRTTRGRHGVRTGSITLRNRRKPKNNAYEPTSASSSASGHETTSSQSWPDMRRPKNNELLAAWRAMMDRHKGDKHEGGAGTVGVFNYQHNDVERVECYRDEAGSDSTLEGARWNDVALHVEDARDMATPPTLHVHGFELVANAECVLNGDEYYSNEKVVQEYYDECQRIVLDACPGATSVVAFDHNVRSKSGRESGRRTEGGSQVQGPASLVHGDYTADSAPRRLSQLAQPPKANDTNTKKEPLVAQETVDRALESGGRYAFVNLWRPIRPVETFPLACCDARTVKEDDLLVFAIHYSDRVGENYFARHDERHRWSYYSSMTPDEALLIKQWESAVDVADGVSRFALHSAFLDPASPADARDRESIEVRCVVLYS